MPIGMKRRIVAQDGPAIDTKRARGPAKTNDMESSSHCRLQHNKGGDDDAIPSVPSSLAQEQEPPASLPTHDTILADLNSRYAPLLLDRRGHVRAKFISLRQRTTEQDENNDPWSILSHLHLSYLHSQNAHKLRAVQSYTPQLRVALPDNPGIPTCSQTQDALTDILERATWSMGYRTPTQDVSFYVSFLDTQATELQEAHVDFDWNQVLPQPNEVYTIATPEEHRNQATTNSNNPNEIPFNSPSARRRTRATILPYPYRVPLVAFFPLTASGMHIEVWKDYETTPTNSAHTSENDDDDSSSTSASSLQQSTPPHPGTLVHIPYGCAFLCRGDVVHAGGFSGHAPTGDPRCHLYIYREGGELHAIHQLRNEYDMPRQQQHNIMTKGGHAKKKAKKDHHHHHLHDSQSMSSNNKSITKHKPVRMSDIYQHGPEAVAFAEVRQAVEEAYYQEEEDDDNSDSESMESPVDDTSRSCHEEAAAIDGINVVTKEESRHRSVPTDIGNSGVLNSTTGSGVSQTVSPPLQPTTIKMEGDDISPTPLNEEPSGVLEWTDDVDSPFLRRKTSKLPSNHSPTKTLRPPLISPDNDSQTTTSNLIVSSSSLSSMRERPPRPQPDPKGMVWDPQMGQWRDNTISKHPHTYSIDPDEVRSTPVASMTESPSSDDSREGHDADVQGSISIDGERIAVAPLTKRTLVEEFDHCLLEENQEEPTVMTREDTRIDHVACRIAKTIAEFTTDMVDYLSSNREILTKRAATVWMGFLRLLFRSLYFAFWLLFLHDVVAGWATASSVIEQAYVPFHPHEAFSVFLNPFSKQYNVHDGNQIHYQNTHL